MSAAAPEIDPREIARALSIPLWFRLDLDLEFVDPRPLQLLEFWRSKFRGPLLPRRDQFEPHELMGHLGHVIILEAEPERRDFRYRLVGTEIVESVGRDVTGSLISDAYDERALRVVSYLADSKQPGRIFGRVDWQDKEFLHYETLLLPLADDGRNVDRILGEMVFPPFIKGIH